MGDCSMDQEKIKILVVSQYFWPEPFKISDLVVELSDAGYDVEVLTSIPNYPDGRVYEEYIDNPNAYGRLGEIRVTRIWQLARGGNSLQLILNYFSFVISAGVHLIKLWLAGKRFDLILAAQLSPIISVIPPLFYARLSKTRIIFWVFDLWPDSILTKRSGSNFFYRVAEAICSFIYRSADTLYISSKGFLSRLQQMGVADESIKYLPQWADYSGFYSRFPDVDKEPRLYFSDDRLNVVFTGNIGSAQNLTEVMEALSRSGVQSSYNFVFIGSGRMLEGLIALSRDKGLEGNVKFIGRRSASELPAYYEQADFLLLPLKSNPVFDLTIPAKLQTYMMAGKPIMAMASGEVKSTIELADCGYVCEENNIDGYVRLLQRCTQLSVTDRSIKGHNARKYAFDNFDKKRVISKFLEELAGEVQNI